MRSAFLLTVCVLIGVISCGRSAGNETRKEKTDIVGTLDTTADFSETELRLLHAQREAVCIAAGLDERQLAAQVIMAGIDGQGYLNRDMQVLLDECPAGGIMLFRYNLDSSPEEIQRLVSETSAYIAARTAVNLTDCGEFSGGSKGMFSGCLLPFVAVDHEGGQVKRFRSGVAALPPAGSYITIAHNSGWDKAIAQIEDDSFRAGAELYNLGINMNFAPVLESLNNYNSEFLGSRLYGPDPDFVTRAAGAFIRGMEGAGLLCVVKHFPGSAGKDPHLYPSIINDRIDELDSLTLPFARLIGSGQARALMVTHTLVTARDSAYGASLSPRVMKDWLRDEWGFSGIIICDDFSMAAVSSTVTGSAGLSDSAAAAVRSLASGADMVMAWPPDLRRTHSAIQNALANGSLSPERLREAAARIICEKIKMELVFFE